MGKPTENGQTFSTEILKDEIPLAHTHPRGELILSEERYDLETGHCSGDYTFEKRRLKTHMLVGPTSKHSVRDVQKSKQVWREYNANLGPA